jgi:hypothetical protein
MILSGLLVILAAINHAQVSAWHGIIPLHSTRADVERVLGPPTPDSKAQYGAEYLTENERVIVSYSTGTCSAAHGDGWRAPAGTVISFSVYPKQNPRLTDLHLDESMYKVSRDPEVLDFTSYTNEKEGVNIEVNSVRGVVVAFNYSPSSKDDYLRCPNRTNSVDGISGFVTRKIAEYSDIPFRNEKKRLDIFAKQLLNASTSQGYIFAYAGKRACADEALRLAKRAKKYLVNKRGIPHSRLVVVDCGYKEQWTIELYIIPPGMPLPPATPTVDPSAVQIIKDCNTRTQ